MMASEILITSHAFPLTMSDAIVMTRGLNKAVRLTQELYINILLSQPAVKEL